MNQHHLCLPKRMKFILIHLKINNMKTVGKITVWLLTLGMLWGCSEEITSPPEYGEKNVDTPFSATFTATRTSFYRGENYQSVKFAGEGCCRSSIGEFCITLELDYDGSGLILQNYGRISCSPDDEIFFVLTEGTVDSRRDNLWMSAYAQFVMGTGKFSGISGVFNLKGSRTDTPSEFNFICDGAICIPGHGI
jgi:hypothetical protein